MTGQAPQTIEQINNTAPLAGPPPSWVPSDPNSLADTGALQDLGRYMAAGGATAPRDQRQPGEPISLDEFIANRQKLADQQLTTYFREAAKADPRVAGEAQRLAVDLNANPIEVERQLPQMRQILAERAAEQRAAAVQSPTLRRQLSDPHFARIAQDQVEPLGFFDGLYKNWRAGQLTTEQGALGDKFRRGIATNSDFANLQYLEKELASLPARSGGPLDGLFRYAGQFSVTLPKAVAVGAMSGTAAAIAGQLGPQVGVPEEIISVPTAFTVGMLTEVWAGSAKIEAGSMYLDMVRDGFDKNTAANVSGIVGIASGALEVVGFGAMAAPAKKALLGEVKRKVSDLLVKPTMGAALKSAGKGYAAGFLGEVGTETLQTINEILAREVARPEGQKRATFDEITTQLADTIVETSKGMLLMGAAGPGMKLAADRRAVLRAQEQQQTIAQFVTRAAEVAPEWKARNPEAFEASLSEMAKENGAEVFYVDGKKLGEILRQQDKADTDAGKGLTKSIANQIDEVVPGFSEQLAEAERTGGDVQIPSATFVAKLGDTPLAAQLAPHMRLDPETMSAFEIAEATNSAKQFGVEAGVQGEKQAGQALVDQKETEFAQSAAKVEETLRADIDKALTDAQANVTKTERAGVSRIASEMVATLAEGTGKTPEQLFNEFRPAFLGGVVEQDAQTLQQPTSVKTDTPEFKAWFGESKVVDADGKPRTVFHGSGANFEEFRIDGFPGAAFFASDYGDAITYTKGRGLSGVREFYLSIKKPISVDAKGAAYDQIPLSDELAGLINFPKAEIERLNGLGIKPKISTDLMASFAKKAGFDGLIIENVNDDIEGFGNEGAGKSVYAVFDPTQIKSVNNRGAFNPNDPNILRQPARGQFGRSRLAILFGEKADASTVLHELTHWYVEVLLRMAQTDTVPAAIQTQLDALWQRWGVADVAAWNALSSEQQRKHLEDISYNAEEYFATGEAPSKELASLFSRIRTWITRIYHAVRDTLNAAYQRETGVDLPALTPELRQFFDRMLASQEAIDMATAERQQSLLFLDEKARKAAGITDEQWAEVQRMDAEARDEAVADLTAKAVRSMGVFEGARMRVVRELQAKLADTRAKVKAEVEAEVDARQVQLARTYVANGTVVLDDGTEVSAKLDTDAVRRILGDEAKLEAYYEAKEAARKEAEQAAVAQSGEIAQARSGAVAKQAGENAATLRSERTAEEQRLWEQAETAVMEKPVHRAMQFMAQGTVNDDGKVKPAKMDRGAVRLLAGKTSLGKAAEVFDKIPANVMRKDGVSPDVLAAQFEFESATAMIEAIAKADLAKDIEKEYRKLRKESGMFDKSLDAAAVRMAAEETVASPAAARSAFAAGAQAARELAKMQRPALIADLLARYTRKKGTSPDSVAQMFGYQNGEQMLRDFLNSPTRDEAVQQRTDERMQAEHSDLTDPKAVRRAIEGAMHTTARAKLIATELRQLLKSTQSTAALIAAAKEAARQHLLRMEVGRISPRAFVKAEARAAKEAREALAKGDVQEAIAAQRRYLFQHELTRHSLDVQKEVDKFVDATDSRYFATDEKVLKARNLDVVQAARSILGEYGLASGRQFEKTLRYLDVLRTQNPELHTELVALVSDVSAEAKDWRSTSLEQFRVMVNAVESLWDRAKRSNEIDVNGKRIAKAAVLDELREASQKRYGDKPQPVRQDTIRARAAASVSGVVALLKRVEPWADWVDGGNGPWTRYVVRPMMKRFDDYMASREKRVQALRDIIKGLELPNERIDASEFLGDGAEFRNTAELLGAMLHMGNASNLQKLLGGYRWAAQTAEGEFDTRGWWRFIESQIAKGRITKAHMDAVQQMWDLMEDLKHEAQKVNRDLYGTYFEEIQAQPFETPWGRYRGGYAPATPDPTRAENADLAVREGLDAIQDAERNFRESMPSAGRGFTKTRNAATRPLTLDVRLVGKHVDQVLRFVHMQPSLRDVASLLRDRELAGYLNAVDPTLINGVLVPWLERVASNRTAQKGKSPFLDGLFAWMRRSAGMATMFGNLTNAAQNITGLSNASVYVKRRYLVGAMWTGWTRSSAQDAAKLSKFMDQLLNSQLGQLQDDIDLALDPSAWGRVKDWTNRHGYFLQRMVQNRVDTIVWWGAFNQTLEESGATMDDAAAVQRAVDEADSVVRKSQGSQRAIDVAAYEAGTPFARLFTQFSGYFNTVANQIASQRGASAKAVAAVHALIFPTFVAGVIAAALNGRDDIEDKDGDGYSDEYAAWFFGQQIRGAAGLVPGFGPNALKALAAWGAVPGASNPGNRLALAPAFSVAESVIRVGGDLPKVLKGQGTPNQVRDFWMVLSLSGVPLAPVGRIQSMLMDEPAR